MGTPRSMVLIAFAFVLAGCGPEKFWEVTGTSLGAVAGGEWRILSSGG